MRLAVIDMGTNTFNLLIAEIFPPSFHTLYSTKEAVKLGQKLKGQHTLSADSIQRIVKVIQKFLDIINTYSVDKTLAIATSSIRTAKNQNEVIQIIKQQFNLDVQVIDGEREADLIYIANCYAAQSCIQSLNDKHFLIMDIGGGSTEFIIFDKNTAVWKQSFLLGMARLMDELQPQDPLSSDDVQKLKNYLDQHLQDLHSALQHYPSQTLIGSSGVFDSIVEMIEANIHPLSKNEQCCVISKNDFYTIFHKILPLSLKERLQFPGLIEMRADMITMSLLLIDYVITKFDIKNFMVSFYSLKEGVILETLRTLN